MGNSESPYINGHFGFIPDKLFLFRALFVMP